MFRAPSRAQAGGRCRPPSPPAQPLAFPSAHKRPPYRSSPPIGRRVRHVAPVVQLGGRARVSALPIVIEGPRGTSRKLSGVETAETAAAPGQPLDPTGLRLSASGPSAASIDNDTRQQQHAAALSRSSVAVGLREAASVTRLCWEVALLWLLGVVVVCGERCTQNDERRSPWKVAQRDRIPGPSDGAPGRKLRERAKPRADRGQ
ncbi:unnamed protein product [Lampetra planeri]